MDKSDSQLHHKYTRLLRALPPLPPPTQLYKKIIKACRRLHDALDNISSLTDRIKALRNSTVGWEKNITELQIIETLVEKQVLQLISIRLELRMLFSIPPLLIATDKISKSNWQAIVTHPQCDEQGNPILVKQSAIEAIIEDHLRHLSDEQAMLNDFRRTLQEEERKESQNFEAAVFASFKTIQNIMKQELKESAKKSATDIITTLLAVKVEMTASLQKAPLDTITALKEAVATAIADSTRKQGEHDNDTGQPHAVDKEYADCEDRERETINGNAEFMEGVQEEEEDPIIINIDSPLVEEQKRQLARELEIAEIEVEELESIVYELDLEPECDPRDFQKGNIRRVEEKHLRCAFCGGVGDHYSDSCFVFPKVADRRQIIMAENRCELCLKTLYQLHDCKKEKSWCYHCKEQGRHHAALCELPERSVENNHRIEQAIERRRVVKERIKEIERQLKELSDL